MGIFSDGVITGRGVTRGAARRENPPVTALPCQPPLGKGAEGTRERIATGALRPRNDGSRKNLRVIPRPVRRLVVGIRNTPAQGTRRADCHSQCAHWLRNDREFYRSAVRARITKPGGVYPGPVLALYLSAYRCRLFSWVSVDFAIFSAFL